MFQKCAGRANHNIKLERARAEQQTRHAHKTETRSVQPATTTMLDLEKLLEESRSAAAAYNDPTQWLGVFDTFSTRPVVAIASGEAHKRRRLDHGGTSSAHCDTSTGSCIAPSRGSSGCCSTPEEVNAYQALADRELEWCDKRKTKRTDVRENKREFNLLAKKRLSLEHIQASIADDCCSKGCIG